MNWHDIIISGGQFALLYAPASMLVRQTRVPVSASFLCMVVLVGFAIAFADLGLLWSTISSALGAATWALLMLQGIQARPEQKLADSYFMHLQLNKELRPTRSRLLFNFTRSQAAVVWTQTDDPNLGVVVLGRVSPAPWEMGDDIRPIGWMSSEAMKTLTPQFGKEASLG